MVGGKACVRTFQVSKKISFVKNVGKRRNVILGSNLEGINGAWNVKIGVPKLSADNEK